MKKLLTLTLTLLTLSALSACERTSKETAASATSSTSAVVSETATLTLQEDGKELATQDVKVTEDTTVYEALSSTFSVKADQGFITEIDGHSQDEKAGKYWLYTVNGQMAEKGAQETPLKAGDKIVFNLQVMK